MKKVKVKFAYCDYCKIEIEKPAKKPLDELQKTLVVVVCLSTLGVSGLITVILIAMLNSTAILTGIFTGATAVVVWAVYTKIIRKSIYCPSCLTKLRFSKEAFGQVSHTPESPQINTIEEEVAEKVEEKKESEQSSVDKEEKENIDLQYCPFCFHKLSMDNKTCPYFQTALKR